MKHVEKKIALALGISSVAASLLMTGCVIRPRGEVAVEAPAAEVTVESDVPDDYVWDGYEYVGYTGGIYVYLGPDHYWHRCEPYRLERFHGWERGHADWHVHAIHNEHYRQAPQRDEHHAAPAPANQRYHDRRRGQDDRDH